MDQSNHNNRQLHESTQKRNKYRKGPCIAAIVLVVAILTSATLFAFSGCSDSGNDKASEEKIVKEKDSKDDGSDTSESNSDSDNEADNKPETGKQPKPEPEPESEPVRTLEELDRSEITVLDFYPDRTVAKRDLKSFADLIEERAAILGSNYNVEHDSNKITLTIEKTLLGETSSEKVYTASLLASRGNIGFREDDNIYSTYSADDSFRSIEVVKLDKSDILNTYGSEMTGKRYKQLDRVDGDTIYALEAKLTKDAQSSLSYMIESSYEYPKFAIVHDYIEDVLDDYGDFFGNMFFVDDRDLSLVYIISPDAPSEKNVEIMKKMLEQEKMDFGLVMDVRDEPIWETSDKKMGAYQKDSMTDGNIIIQWTPDIDTYYNNSEIDLIEFKQTIKDRLDILEIDYMFGTFGLDNKTYCVRLNSEEFAPDFIRLIYGSDGLSVRTSFEDVSVFSSPEVVYDDGSYALRLYSYYTKERLMESEYLDENTKLFLVANDVTIASAYAGDLVDYNEYSCYIDFEEFLCFDDPVAKKDERNVLDLVCSIYDDSDTYKYGNVNFRINNSGDESEPIAYIDWKYSSLTAEDKRVLNILADECYLADKYADNRNMLYITLDIPVNDDLPINFLKKVEEIYNLCSFDSGAYNEIVFVIKDEKIDSPADEFRLTVTKDEYDGKMEFMESVDGPKFWDYWYDTYTLMGEIPFYIERSWR